MQAELQRLQHENVSLNEGLKRAVELLKQSRAEAQAKDAEIAELEAQLQKFEGEPPT